MNNKQADINWLRHKHNISQGMTSRQSFDQLTQDGPCVLLESKANGVDNICLDNANSDNAGVVELERVIPGINDNDK